MRLTSFTVGSLIFLAGTFGCFVLGGGVIRVLFFPLPMLAEALIPIGSCIVAYGLHGFLNTCGAGRILWTNDPTGIDRPRAASAVSFLITSSYFGGALVFLMNLLFIMANLSEVAAHGLNEDFGRAVARTIASLLYPILVSEGLLRPLKQRLSAVTTNN